MDKKEVERATRQDNPPTREFKRLSGRDVFETDEANVRQYSEIESQKLVAKQSIREGLDG